MNYLAIAKAIENKVEHSNCLGNLSIDKELSRLYGETVKRFEDRWELGYYERIGAKNPQLLAKIGELEDSLNNLWVTLIKGKGNIEEFKKILNDWGICHLKVINSMRFNEPE